MIFQQATSQLCIYCTYIRTYVCIGTYMQLGTWTLNPLTGISVHLAYEATKFHGLAIYIQSKIRRHI